MFIKPSRRQLPGQQNIEAWSIGADGHLYFNWYNSSTGTWNWTDQGSPT